MRAGLVASFHICQIQASLRAGSCSRDCPALGAASAGVHQLHSFLVKKKGARDGNFILPSSVMTRVIFTKCPGLSCSCVENPLIKFLSWEEGTLSLWVLRRILLTISVHSGSRRSFRSGYISLKFTVLHVLWPAVNACRKVSHLKKMYKIIRRIQEPKLSA